MATPTHTHRSASHTHNLPSRPTTPLRPISRTSLRASTTTPTSSQTVSSFPLETLEPAFAELSDSLADLEANMLHLQILHESISRFNENFASFLYGLNMSAFCVDFPEAPGTESFKRAKDGGGFGTAGVHASPGRALGQGYGMGQPQPQTHGSGQVVTGGGLGRDVDATFLTTDTSFIENPPGSTRPASKFTAPAASGSQMPAARGSTTRGRGIPSARGSTRGSTRGSSTTSRGSGIGRGRARGVR